MGLLEEQQAFVTARSSIQAQDLFAKDDIYTTYTKEESMDHSLSGQTALADSR